MKRRLLVALLLALAGHTAMAGPNLLLDPHFDNASLSGSGWTVNTSGGMSFSWSSTPNHYGSTPDSGSAHAAGIDGNAFLLQCVEVPPDATVGFGVQIFPNYKSLSISLWQFASSDCSGASLAQAYIPDIPVNGLPESWRGTSMQITTNAATHSAQLQLGVGAIATIPNEVYVDDPFVGLSPVTPISLQEFHVD